MLSNRNACHACTEILGGGASQGLLNRTPPPSSYPSPSSPPLQSTPGIARRKSSTRILPPPTIRPRAQQWGRIRGSLSAIAYPNATGWCAGKPTAIQVVAFGHAVRPGQEEVGSQPAPVGTRVCSLRVCSLSAQFKIKTSKTNVGSLKSPETGTTRNPTKKPDRDETLGPVLLCDSE